MCEAKDLNPVQHRLSGPFREKAGKPWRTNPHTSPHRRCRSSRKRGSRSKKARIPSAQSSVLKRWSLSSSVSLTESSRPECSDSSRRV